MASISEREKREIEVANASGNTPVVFNQGLRVLPSGWASWAHFFQQAGYAPLTPDWPADPATVAEAPSNPDVLAKKTLTQIADHTTEVINALDNKPVVMGRSTGGLLAQMLAGQGLSAATVAIDPGVFRGVLPLPLSVLKSSGPFLINPLNRRRAITFTFKQFQLRLGEHAREKEAKELYDTFHVAGSGIALAQMGNATLSPWTQAKVNTKNPDRGPLLIIEGENDHTVPWAIAHAAYKRQRRNPAVTEIVKIPTGGTPSRSTTAGARSPRRRSTSSSGSPPPPASPQHAGKAPDHGDVLAQLGGACPPSAIPASVIALPPWPITAWGTSSAGTREARR